MHQAAAAWHCFWGRPRSFALLWLRLPCCLISVPFAVAMPTRLALPHQRAAALWSTQGMRHAACGTPTAHNSLQLPKDAQWKWSGRRRRSWSRYSKFTLQLKFRFDAAILLAHLAHALRGRAQRVEGGGGVGEQHCFVAPLRAWRQRFTRQVELLRRASKSQRIL